MGLDTYAARIPVDFLDSDLDVDQVDESFGCTRWDLLAFWWAGQRRERAGGGLFVGNYFRGNIYAPLIQHVSGVWIERTWIPPETVKEMWTTFNACDPEQTIRDYEEVGGRKGEYHASDVADLRAFFRVCAKRGLGLVGSW